ncbi:hypothetical protein C8Q78DRAFT_66588 [Trametes maxima]|nr:hypothetical protein C8Q78DRAFT_66588 [Trametes maxima]
MRFAKSTQPGTPDLIQPVRTLLQPWPGPPDRVWSTFQPGHSPSARSSKCRLPTRGTGWHRAQCAGSANPGRRFSCSINPRGYTGRAGPRLRQASAGMGRNTEDFHSHEAKAIQVVDKTTAGHGVCIGRTTPCDAYPLHATPLDNGVDRLSRGFRL